MTKLSDLPGYSENAPKKEYYKPANGVMDTIINKCIEGQNGVIDAFSELTLGIDESELWNIAAKVIAEDDCCTIHDARDMIVKTIASNPQRFIKIERSQG